MARTYNTLFLAVLVLFNTHDMQVSAQMGTVQNALFDYIRMNSGSQPQPPTNTMQQPQISATAAPPSATNVGTGGADLFSSFTQGSQPATNTNTQGTSPGGSFMDMFASTLGSAGTQQTAQTNTGAVQTPTATVTKETNPMDFYNQLMQVVNPSTSQSQPQPQPQPQPQLSGQTMTNPQPSMDPFSNSPQPATSQNNQVQPQPQQPPKLLPFVPPEWNLPPAQTSQANPWGSSSSHGTTGWGHQSHHQGPTAWEQYYNPNHRPTPRPTPMARNNPPPHPMGQMMMIPRVRDMINKQATQFGDLAYYQQHGCVDPTPTRPGPGGIRPSQTLWYGCQSPVSKMVCTRVGQTAGGPSGAMSMMMSMMNPQMMRTFEKCLSPKMLTKMMFQGMSGGMGSMNPAMMMMMGGGGGGGMASMMPVVMMMMNQQNQAAGGMGGGLGGGMSGGMTGGSTGGLTGGTTGGLTGGSMTGGLTPTSSPATGTNSVPTSSGSSKLSYKDPSSANTLISQAARIPTPAGAALPQQPASTNPFSSVLGGLFGMGGGANTASATQTATNLPFGAASPGAASNSLGGGSFGAQQQPQEVDCSSVMPLVMSRVMAAGEGIASPEAQEAIGELRKQYLPYSCQELRLTYTGLPLRLCCPGRVDPPTMMDLFKAKSAGGA